MASSAVKVSLIESPKSVLGEGPHWDAESQNLYYIDIYGTEYSVLRYSLTENKTYGATIDGEPNVSFIIPVAGTTDQFAVGIGRRVGVIQWDGESSKAKLLRVALQVEDGPEFKENRFNDAKADPSGRLYAGTMHVENCDLFELSHGAFYKFAANESLVKLREPVRISNGLAWNEKTNKFYYIDSCDLDVKEFDYDPATGNICKLEKCKSGILLEMIQFFYLQLTNVSSSISRSTANVPNSFQTAWQSIRTAICMSALGVDRKLLKSIQRKLNAIVSCGPELICFRL